MNRKDPSGLFGENPVPFNFNLEIYWLEFTNRLKRGLTYLGLGYGAVGAAALAPSAVPATVCHAARSYRWGMAAAGTPLGQKILEETPNFIDALLPGPPPPTISGHILGSYELFDTLFGTDQ